MHRQLKQTAFFGTDREKARRRPLNGRHYKARGDQPARTDVDACYVVGWPREATADALKFVSGLSVPLVDQMARWTFPARVARIDKHDRRTTLERLVDDQTAFLVETPVVQSCPLAPWGLNPATDTLEVFQGYRAPVAFGDGNDCFTDAVVGVALESGLSSGRPPQRPFSRSGSFLLEDASPRVLALANGLDVLSGVGRSVVIDRDIDHTEVNTQHVGRCVGRCGVGIAGQGKHPLAPNQHQVCLPFGSGKHLALARAADERNDDAARQRPDRHTITRQKPEDAFIVGLCGVRTKRADGILFTGLEAVSDLRDAANRRLRRQPETCPRLGIDGLVDIVLASDALLVRGSGDPRASRVALFQRFPQQRRVLSVGKQSDGSDQLHRSGALLGFDVAAHDSFRNRSNGTGVVAAAPQRRKPRTKRRELLPKNAAGPALEAVDDLGNRQRRVRLNEQVHVVGHHFHGVDRHVVFGSDFHAEFLESVINRRDKHLAPVLRAPDQVVFEAENSPNIGAVSWFGVHRERYTTVAHIASIGASRPALSLRQLKQTVSRGGSL
jgi:hypothetical protein